MSLKRKFCHSIPLLTPAIFETLTNILEEEEQAERGTVHIRCRGIGLPREFWEIMPTGGRRRI